MNSESQTENLPKVDRESQTELSNHNITTVDKIEVVDSMETSGTQADQNELDDMSSFKGDRRNIPADELDLSNGGDKDSNSEVESTFSSVSKKDDRDPVKVSAGLDMRVGKYKEVTFPPVSGLPNKPTTLKAPPSERTPSPMDLCTKEIGKEEKHKESSVTRKREIGSTISGSPYDYYKPAKSRRIDDMRIIPAHQGDVNISPRSTVHLSPTCLMSASTAILKTSSISTIHGMPERDLSVKSADIEYGHTPAVPSTIRSSRISPLEGFGKLSLQPEFRPHSIFKFGMEHKFPKNRITPFSLPSEIQKSPILRSSESDDEPTFQKLQKRNAKSKSVNKVQLYRDMLAKKDNTEDEIKTRRTAELICEAEKSKDINFSTESMKEKEIGTSPKVTGLKIGCTVSRGRGLKHFLGTTHPKKLLSKAQSTSKKEISGTKPNSLKTGKKEEEKIPRINIEKVDDRVVREMGDRSKVANDEHKPKKVSNVMVTTKQLETNDKENRNEVPMNIKSSANDDASLTFKDLKNSQKTSDESEESSQLNDSNSSDDRGDAGDSKSTSDYEDAGDINEDIEEEEYEDGEAVDDDEYEEDSKSFNSTNEDINIENPAAYKKKVLTSPKSIASRIKDYSKKIGQEGIKFTSAVPLKNLNIIPEHPKSDLKGYKSPMAKQQQYLKVSWNQEMMMSSNNELVQSDIDHVESVDVPENTSQQPEEVGNGDNTTKNGSHLDNLDPTNVGSIPDNIFDENIQPVTSTPKPSRRTDEGNRSFSEERTTSVDEDKETSPVPVPNTSGDNSAAEGTLNNADNSTSLDETNKPPNDEKKVPDIKFLEILKGNLNL